MYKILLLTLLLIISSMAFAQKSTLVKPNIINSATEKSTTVKKINNTVLENAVTKTYLVKNEEYYTQFIEALKIKRDIVQNSPEQNTKAEAIQWFTKIDIEISKAEKELNKLKGND